MRDSWQLRIDRATQLAVRDETAKPLLTTYARLLALQRDCYESLRASAAQLSGWLERDLPIVRECVPPILGAVAVIGPPALAEEAREITDGGEAAIDSVLRLGWRAPSNQHFFARVALQPYANCLASHKIPPRDRDLPRGDNVCPFCGGAPQVSVLQPVADAEPGRQLLCATCFTTWPFRRVLCAKCGEEDERQLGYFHSPAYDHLRVDACETCKHYLKTVDLTRLGIAVPIVDEVAGAPLDLWARDQGYEKIELNLLGL
jgi:Protein involved in formate dehydrogenase formation